VSEANQYLLRAPFSLQKITWNPATETVTYRSPDPPFDLETFEPIDPPWPAIREWIPADDHNPQAVFPEDSVTTHWVPKEIRLDDERTLVLDLS
jgi:hypothetical protein